MSGGILNKRFQALAVAVVMSSFALFGSASFAASAATTGKTAANVKSAMKTASSKSAAASAAAKAKIPASAARKTPTPPPIAGFQKVVSPDKAKSLAPDATKLVPSAKSYSEQLAILEKQANGSKKTTANKKSKTVRSRKLVIDARVFGWASRASDAMSLSYLAARKLVGNKRDFLTKDSAFITDKNSRIGCYTRINFTDMIPENWYLETEMVVGFGNTYERAYGNSLDLAFSRVKTIRNADWIAVDSAAKNFTDLGVIPYSVEFAKSGNEYYCKLFFRYFKPRQ